MSRAGLRRTAGPAGVRKSEAARSPLKRGERAAFGSVPAGRRPLLVGREGELAGRRERLAGDAVADADDDLVVAGRHLVGREQARERQALPAVGKPLPVFGLLEQLL